MTHDIRARAADVLSEALGTSLSAEENPQRHQLDAWDSLKHMELILLLEEEFNVRFSMEQAVNLNSLDDIVNILGELQ
ncbi:phosphopantetheine-binding protein [Paenibacillus gansuensis]|uniref:Phosphopantetheine-binding protein n=1 Tax=Paenibacillus gansuensis TaxID=306542 RepID=A0ABW5PBM6_9BACL